MKFRYGKITKKRLFIYGCVSALIFFLLGILYLNYVTVGAFEDDAVYVSLGGKLVSNLQYRIPCFPSGPLCGKYPPLYPLFLGLSSKLIPSLPAGLPFLKVAGLALALPGIFFFTLWIFRRSGYENVHRPLTYIIAFIVATHADLLFFSKELMSETLFFSLVMIGLWVAKLIESKNNGKGPDKRAYLWMFLIGIFMFYTRSIGIVFIFSLIMFAVFQRQIRLAIAMAGATAIMVLPWFWWSRYWVPANEPMADVIPYFITYGYHTEALKEFFLDGTGKLVGKMCWYIKVNFVATLHAIESMVFPAGPCHASVFSVTSLGVPSFFTFIFVCVGFFRSFRGREFTFFFMVCYLLFVMVWPWSNKVRFMVPVAPILICYFIEGVALLTSRFSRLQKIIPVAICTGILLTNFLWSFKVNLLTSTLFVRTYGTESQGPLQKGPFLESIEWIKENVPENAILLAGNGCLGYYIHTGRQVLPYRTLTTSPAEHLKRMYNLAVSVDASLLTPQIIKRLRRLFPDREFYQLDIFPKKSLTNFNTLNGATSAIFEDNSNDGSAIIVRKLAVVNNK